MAEKRVSNVLTYSFASIISILMSLPMYMLVIGSLKTEKTIFDFQIIPRFQDLTLDNYIQVLKTQSLGINIYNSFFVATIVTIVALIFHSMAAYPLARLRFPGKDIIFKFILSTMMVPFAVIMIPLFIIIKKMGLVNNLWGVILPCIPHAYGVFLLRQFFLGIPKEIEESVWIDGLSFFGTYRKIIMPLSKPILVTLGICFFLYNWNNYLWPLIIAQKRELWLIQIAIANFRSEKNVHWNLILAASCLAALPMVILFFIFQRYIVEGIKTSGIKM